MDIVLGVSMTPAAVRMVLVEGEQADGATLDQNSFGVAPGVGPATSDAPERVVAAILGTRESAMEGGHRLAATGVAWTDHAAAARLRQALRAQRIDDVILVSELHAASALAQAVGRAVDYERTALLFLERDTATLAVVRTADGVVVRVAAQRVDTAAPMADLQAMLTGLDAGAEAPQALFMVGTGLESGIDIAALMPQVADLVGLPVHVPEEGELALARGAALAAANTPRYEAATVGLLSRLDTAAGPTQPATAGYMAPLGYSAMPDDDIEGLDDLDGLDSLDPCPESAPEPDAKPERASFVLLGSAVSTLFVVGVVALIISLAVAIRPTVDQPPVPSDSAVVSNNPAPVPPQAQQPGPPGAPAPETIQEPIPVVQEAPRTVYATPRQADPPPAPEPAAPPPAPEPPAPERAPAPAPAPASAQPPPAPAPAIVPPIVVPIPIVPSPVLPSIFQLPRTPFYPSTVPTLPTLPALPPYPTSAPRITQSAPVPSTQPSYPTAPTAPVTSYPTYTPPVTTVAPSRPGRSGTSGSSGSSAGGSQPIWPPVWPFGG